MDYVIDSLEKNGFKPETRREQGFVEELKQAGFVYFDKNINMFKFRDDVIKTETPDEITLCVKPRINYLGLFPKVDNFVTGLTKPRERSVLLEFLSNDENSLDKVTKKLGGFKLGQEFTLTALGYGKSDTNEGYKFEVPEELTPLMYKGNNFCFFTTGLSKGAKDRDTKNLDFIGVRPAKIIFKLGISTTFGVFYDLDEFKLAGNKKVIDKATLK